MNPMMNALVPLPSVEDPPFYYRIVIPVEGLKWLTANQRGSWLAHHADIRRWRKTACWCAKASQVPPLEGAHIIAELRFRIQRKRDAHNWFPTAKACVDGLVDAGVLPDDDSSHLIGPDMRIGPATPRGTPSLVILHCWPFGISR